MGHRVEQARRGVHVYLDGSVTAGNARHLYDELLALARRPELETVDIDFSALRAFDSPAAAAICSAIDQLREAGKRAELSRLNQGQRLAFELLPPLPKPSLPDAPTPWLEQLGERAVRAGGRLVQLSELMVDTVVSAATTLRGRQRLRWGALLDQCEQLGVRAVFIVGLLTFLTGLILAFQAIDRPAALGRPSRSGARLALVDVLEIEERWPAQISGGQSKRAALARATILDPSILFCDEPTSALDPLAAAQVDGILLRLRDAFRMGIIAVTHDPASVRTISDRVVALSDGRVRAVGRVADIERAVPGFFERSRSTTKPES